MTIPLTLTSSENTTGGWSQVTPGLPRGTSFTAGSTPTTTPATTCCSRAPSRDLVRGIMTCESSNNWALSTTSFDKSTYLHARQNCWQRNASRRKRRRGRFPRASPAGLPGSRNCGMQGDLPNSATVAQKYSFLGSRVCHCRTAKGPSDLRVPSSLHHINVRRCSGPTRAIFQRPLICDASNDRAYGTWMGAVRDQASVQIVEP